MDGSAQIASDDDFSDVVAANAAYARSFRLQGLPAVAGLELGVVTCMDSRIEPLAHARPGPRATPRSSATPAPGSPTTCCARSCSPCTCSASGA